MRILVLLLAVTGAVAAQTSDGPSVVSIPAAGSLYEMQIVIRAGSADDPAGREGLASLTGRLLVEGGFGSSTNPVTKERLAQITRPWGAAAMPTVTVDKQTTTLAMTVPREVFGQYVDQIVKPMFQQPLWMPAELDRVRREALTTVESRLPFELQEELGLEGLDNFIFTGTPLQHLAAGTVEGLKAASRDDLAAFARGYYTRDNMSVASTITDDKDRSLLLAGLPAAATSPAPRRPIQVQPVSGRELLVVTQPGAIASGIHAGFPMSITRNHPDYWPLFVGNVFFGTHRDSFGRLYTLIREERGYNYGNYSYVEYLAGRPSFQFPPPGAPRTHQYFSIWIRPVAHQYVHFLTKAFMFELERLLHDGLTAREVAEAKIKARTLYLNYAASKDRQLGYRLDDLFYGMKEPGYLGDMLAKIDAATPDQVNAALRKHLQAANMKFLIVTHPDQAAGLVEAIVTGRRASGKTMEEYHIAEPVPPEKRALLERDKQWAAYPLGIVKERVRVVKADDVFRR